MLIKFESPKIVIARYKVSNAIVLGNAKQNILKMTMHSLILEELILNLSKTNTKLFHTFRTVL